MKYVMFQQPDGLIFPMTAYNLTGHDFIASCVTALYPGIKPISAGFCSVSENKLDNTAEVAIWGESISLKLKSNPDDAWRLKKMFDQEY